MQFLQGLGSSRCSSRWKRVSVLCDANDSVDCHGSSWSSCPKPSPEPTVGDERLASIKPLLEGDAGLALANLPEAIRYLLMPMVAVSVYSISRNSRLIRSAVLEALRQDYAVAARADCS